MGDSFGDWNIETGEGSERAGGQGSLSDNGALRVTGRSLSTRINQVA